ncbi:MAG TPA: transglutaminase family protein [Opitutaceae bacterium]|nr:transglutaminase family protein [Opitutaceae bacterium]
MAIHVALHHRTTYRYDRAINLGPHIIRLRPAPHTRTRLLGYSLRVVPEKHFLNWQQDPQSNHLARIVFPDRTRELWVEVDLVAEMAVFNPFDFFLEPAAENFPFAYDLALEHELAPFRLCAGASPRFAAYLAGIPRAACRTIDFLVDLNRRLCRDIKYLIRLEPGVQTPEETLTLRTGSCRDSAWLLVQLLRHLGFAARFVSGYLIQLVADQKSLDGPSGAEKDFTDLHAWCEVYLPGAGWIGFDPTSGLLAGEGHIPLAATPDPQSAAPIDGGLDECKVEFDFEMKVTRIHEAPRVTKPYTEEQWRAIDALGCQVDAALAAGDVRLTMGGEPTFVSIDDYDGAEWNNAALGPTKRARADALIRRLRERFAPGSFLHYGQGKWYPGESLPRWAFAAYWRKDGQPVWEDPHLLADEKTAYGHTAELADVFIRSLAGRLGVEDRWVMPAYEDAFYYLWKERRLPSNVDPFDSNLANAEERARLARVFERGLDNVVGHVLPLQRRWSPQGPEWASGPWFLRSERLYLIPGDSPLGFRLPLDSQPWTAAGDYPYVNETDPLATRPPLPARQRFVAATTAGAVRGPRVMVPIGTARESDLGRVDREPGAQESAAWIVRTALCVEPREGRLHVFLPPTVALEDYLAVITAVEATAAALGVPVTLEGYPPPHDSRLNVIKVTPDPGVIEVNIHPAASWPELVERTTGVYEDARQSRLGSEKFLLDGRHTGTGGGNHLLIGGATPADSPLLRRPDLLRSLVTYWQHHPALSFLFSGLFIGPTSQSPRIDEARLDAVRELELAFAQIPASGDCPPWLVDRVLRHLLVDATGNTHRAEFCIDKLYPPESSAGRLGLLELRAFEMPPHERMSLVQQLLLRALVARFWHEPYAKPLVRWGTQLHDRWMLPHFVARDVEDICADLARHGHAFAPEWFAPHQEFRFPTIGDFAVRDIRLELRQALEPWHVLGEEPGAGGTVRFVDSSVERLQVKVNGLTDGRHVVTCNGRALPLQPTGTQGEFVAGVRFRAWQPPSCLHPTIGVHTPLVFDVVDTWNDRAVGGCTYHVAHPGGRNHVTLPVNAYEAESRRLARFFRHGHTPGTLKPWPVAIDPEFPCTLDLRKE